MTATFPPGLSPNATTPKRFREKALLVTATVVEEPDSLCAFRPAPAFPCTCVLTISTDAPYPKYIPAPFLAKSVSATRMLAGANTSSPLPATPEITQFSTLTFADTSTVIPADDGDGVGVGVGVVAGVGVGVGVGDGEGVGDGDGDGVGVGLGVGVGVDPPPMPLICSPLNRTSIPGVAIVMALPLETEMPA